MSMTVSNKPGNALKFAAAAVLAMVFGAFDVTAQPTAKQQEKSMSHKAYAYTELQISTPFENVPWKRAYSAPNWTPIPRQTGHLVQRKLDTHSTANWTPSPAQTGHRFRSKLDSLKRPE